MPGGPVLHLGAIKLRVNGVGKLSSFMLGYDRIESENLTDVPLSPTMKWEVTLLSNFQGERMRYVIYSNEMDAQINVSHITLFVKPLWMSNPI